MMMVSAPLFSSDLRNVLCDCDVLGYRMIRPVLPGALPYRTSTVLIVYPFRIAHSLLVFGSREGRNYSTRNIWGIRIRIHTV